MNSSEMQETLKELLEAYIKKIQGIKDRVPIRFLKTYNFKTGENNDSKNKSEIEKIEKKDFIIYVIRTNEELTQEQAEEGYSKLKNDEETKYGTFRVNNEEEDNHFIFQGNNSEKYLYVGSSQDIRKRLKEHLGINGDKTYALHLSKWWEDREIMIDLYEVTTDAEEMQLFEDRLWEYYKPLLGKQGKK